MKTLGDYSKIIIGLLFISIITIVILFGTPLFFEDNSNSTKNGTIDLSECLGEKIIPLTGEWEFYWNKFLNYDDFTNMTSADSIVTVPSVWNGYVIDGKKLSGKGYATYRLHVTGVEAGTALSMRVCPFSTSYELYIDKELIASSGKVSADESNCKPAYRMQTVTFTPQRDNFNIIIHIANFTYARGGAWYTPYIGTPQQIESLNRVTFGLYTFMLGCFSVMAVFSLCFYIFRRNKSVLAYAVVCILFACRLTTYGNYLIDSIFPQINFNFRVKFEYLSTFLIPNIYFFMHAGSSIKMLKRASKIIIAYSLMLVITIAVLPVYALTHLTYIFEIIMMIISIHIIIALLKAVKMRKRNSVAMLLGVVILIICASWDVFVQSDIIKFGQIEYWPFGFVLVSLIWGLIFIQEYDFNIRALEKTIKQKEIIEKKVLNMAYFDVLTGLPNRLLFADRLKQAIYDADRKYKGFAVLLVNIDGFKRINDTVGRIKADEIIVQIANRMTNTLRKGDTVARVGGDEFLILADNLDDVKSGNSVANKVLEVFKNPFKADDHELYLSASIGCAVYPYDGDNTETLIINADAAMYSAKINGKNRIEFCSTQMKNDIKEELLFANALYRVLENNELELYYQPQVNSFTNNIVGMEALIRWNHPNLGLISPQRFIPIAEKTGLIVPIGKWIIRKACMQCREWIDAGFEQLPISVNISAYQFNDKDFVDYVIKILEETHVPPEDLKIEITESTAMNKIESTIQIMESLKLYGIEFAIDDFGTAYSSLNYIKRIPVKTIKIDKSFIDGIGFDKKDEAIIESIITLAKNLGLNIIAEGVEMKSQVDFLADKGCSTIQGYYYFKPMCADDISKIMKQKMGALAISL